MPLNELIPVKRYKKGVAFLAYFKDFKRHQKSFLKASKDVSQ